MRVNSDRKLKLRGYSTGYVQRRRGPLCNLFAFSLLAYIIMEINRTSILPCWFWYNSKTGLLYVVITYKSRTPARQHVPFNANGLAPADLV